MDGGAVVIRGPPRNGPPAERILALTNIDAPRLARRKTANADATEDAPFAWDAREYLRKMVVGKTVLGSVVHTAQNRYRNISFHTVSYHLTNVGIMENFCLEKTRNLESMLLRSSLKKDLPKFVIVAVTKI